MRIRYSRGDGTQNIGDLDARWRRAKALYVTGGKVYGYDNIEVVDANSARQSVRRRINETREVIRRIFQQYADGIGMLTIASAQRRGREAATWPRWAPSGIREMPHRPL